MKTAAMMLLTAVATYYVASFIQTIFHRVFGHAPRIFKLYDVHVRGHHAQYARQMLSDRWIPTEQHITWYYSVPFIPMVCAAYCLLPGIDFIAHLCGLAFAIWWHVYLHRQYHIRGTWWEHFGWFREKRRLHFLHHQKPHKNFAIVEYSWDLLLGTFDDSRVTQVPLDSNGSDRRLSAEPVNRSADLQSAYRSDTEISLTTQSRLQIGAPGQGRAGVRGLNNLESVRKSNAVVQTSKRIDL